MPTRRTWAFLSLGLVSLGVYRYRRQLIGRWLGLRPASHNVRIKWKLDVPMPDGTILAADLYTPRAKRADRPRSSNAHQPDTRHPDARHPDARFPTILIRTPYGRGPTAGPSGILPSFIAHRFAERGYNVVVQDVRGRFDSQGEFEPFANEAADGLATIQWLEAQPWFNGSLGMWGQSYVGYVQWAVADGAPPSLQALVPSVSGARIATSGVRDGAFGMDTLARWILQLDAMDRQGAIDALKGYTRLLPSNQKRILERAFSHLPLLDADEEIVGSPVSYYRTWLSYADTDGPYWQAMDHSRRMADITAHVHQIGGWYDIFLRETLSDYRLMRQAGHQPYLTIGPWTHADRRCLVESLRQGLLWSDAYLKGERGILRDLPVRLYVMGGGGWRELPDWPVPAQEILYYLHENGGLSPDLPHSASPADNYIYDPQDPTPALGGPIMSAAGGPRDNRPLEARPDVLSYTSEPFTQDVDVIGPVSLRLYLRSSRAHTDFFGRVCDVFPDGRSINLCDGLFRLEPGRGSEQADGSLLVTLDLWATANRFQRGHCLRLQVSSGAHPRWSRNLGSDEPLASGNQFFPAHQTIYHDAAHPSALILPVMRKM